MNTSKFFHIVAYIITFILILYIFLIEPMNVKRPNTVSLETNPIGWLVPHEHDHTDSIMTSSHHVISYSNIITTKEDWWIKGFSYSIKNAKETVLHHAVLATLNKKDLHCPERDMYYLIGVGEDQMYNPNLVLPKGYAVFIPKGSQIFLYTMLHNPKPPVGYGENHYNVSSLIELDLADKDEILSLKPVEFIRLDLTDKPCSSDESGYVFNVPANTQEYTFGSSSEKMIGSSYTFTESGKIIYMGGHMHGWEGGKYISFYVNGKLVRKYETSKAKDDPYRFDTPHQEENIHVNKGDFISITATYENNSEEKLTGAMGMLGIYFAKD
jgi:hypothetical protein